MEQLRTIVAWLRRYHFWVLSALVAVIGLACWYTSAGALDKQFNANKSIIQAKFNAPKTIAGEAFHPNPQISDKQKEENRKRAQSVAAIWQQLYDRQRNEVLKWPLILPQDFRGEVEKLKFGQDIPLELRTRYQNYIEGYFEELPKKVQAKITEGSGGGRGGDSFSGGGRGGPDEFAQLSVGPTYVCEWLDQHTVRSLLDFPDTPSPLKIWVTQEDLWAYETLLNVVAATNASVQADRPGNAAVRVIETLEVGKPAAKITRTSRIDLPDAARAVSAAAGADASGRGGGEVMDISMDGRGGPGGLTPEQEAAALLSGRYVDSSGNPKSIAGGTTDYQSAFGTEYKRLPVRLILLMDIRSLDYLITQCANQPLQVEVQEVRINPSSVGDAGGRGGGPEMEFLSRGPGEVSYFPLNPHLARVVIQGVIYIFNEPNVAILQAAGGAEPAVAN